MENIQHNNYITLDELKQLIVDKKQQVRIIDVRSREEYTELHIPRAINIAITQLEMAGNLFDKTDTIITVCGKGGGRSTEAVEKLKRLGFKSVNWLFGGTYGWYEHP